MAAIPVLGAPQRRLVPEIGAWRQWPRPPRRVLHAVQDVGCTIARGSSFGPVGESGPGKSTVARMITGLTRPTAGSIGIDGHVCWADRASAAALRRRFPRRRSMYRCRRRC